MDFDRRGAWIAVNEYGLSICLLNGSPPWLPPERSRGFLIPGLIHARDLDHAAALAGAADLRPYAPCSLLFLQPQRTALIVNWDGERIALFPDGERHKPLTSSSADPEGARAALTREFGMRHRTRPVDLYDFHSWGSRACIVRTPGPSASVGLWSRATTCDSSTRPPRRANGDPANRSSSREPPDDATLLSLATFASEDLACAAAGAIIARGQLGYLQGTLACLA